ncbi:MAG: carbon storage regulator [Lachnospiraceae bacterium]|nr:carbon storage regulator [Lachnospiraceae bacterium]
MLRMSMKKEEYLLIGDDVKIVFLGGAAGHIRIMVDAPKDVNIVRSRAMEKRIQDPEELAKLPKYYEEPEHPEKYQFKKKKSNMVIVRNDNK